jgi:hypothetical protein
MPKANLRSVPGSPPFQDFECSVCKARLSFKFEVAKVEAADPRVPAALAAAIWKEWDAHLFNSHLRQWEFEQKKKAKLTQAWNQRPSVRRE